MHYFLLNIVLVAGNCQQVVMYLSPDFRGALVEEIVANRFFQLGFFRR